MDNLRGLAILLMLAWHAPAIPVLFGVAMPRWLEMANDALLPFRMPLLMFLSGLLLVRSLEKSTKSYYLGKFQMLAWPYLLWAGLHNLTFKAVAPLWHPRAWISTGYLWFLFFVLCFYLVAPLVRRLPAGLLPALCFAGAFVVDDRLLHRMLYFGGFFFVGYLAAQHPTVLHRIVDRRWVAVVSLVPAAVVAWLSAVGDVQALPEFAPASLAGIIAVLHVARRIGDARWTGPLQFVGRHSLIYYTTHFPVMQLTLTGLLGVGVSSSTMIAPVTFLTAAIVGTAAAVVARRSWVRWLFVAPIVRASRRKRPDVDGVGNAVGVAAVR